MKKRMRSLLGMTTAVELVLVLVLMICVSSSSQYSLCHGNKITGCGRGPTARKLLSGTILTQQQQQKDLRVDVTVKPLNQTVVSLRKIPPSSSNPTQNKSRPRVNGRGNRP